MNSTDTMAWLALHDLEARHWHDVNCNGGVAAHEFYEEDGVFAVGDTRHAGRDTIRNFYAWRRDRGDRVARHCITNLIVDVDPSGSSAVVKGIICLFAADGVPVFESQPPTMVADFLNKCVKGSDDRWRYKTHILTPLFRGGGRLDTSHRT